RIFDEAGVTPKGKTTRNKVLKEVGKVVKPRPRPSLTQKHKKDRLDWARANLKRDFSTVIWTDEARATLDGPDNWATGWILNGSTTPVRVRRQQGGGGVMIWAAIVGDQLVGPTRVPNGVKLNSQEYTKLLTSSFLPWYRSRSASVKRKLIWMHDNAPAHNSHHTRDFLAKKGFKDQKLMTWPACSPDLNPIEHLWSIIKRRVYADGRQYGTAEELWKAIEEVSKNISREEVQKLTQSVDS
ncbi:hypothetical protein FOZ61_004295, partial [Perkinsus olseni]